MGATTALLLARAGMHCVLIDKKYVCAEASGVNAGTLTLHMTRAALVPYALNGWAMWMNASQWLGIDPGVTEAPGLSLAFTEEEEALLESRARARRERGAPIELVSARRAREIEPGLSANVRAAAFCAKDGHVTANRTGLAFKTALAAAGVTLIEQQAVDGVTQNDGHYVVRAGSTNIKTHRVVLAGGVWLQNMLGWFGFEVPIKALVNQLIITERMEPAMATVISVANGLLSLKQFANGTVLIGGGWQGHGDKERSHTEIIPDNLIGNVRLARYAIPALGNSRIARAWLGFEAETADAMPIACELPGYAGAYAIGSVHSGYTSGPYVAKLLADLILDRTPERPLFDLARLL